ncbi:MAG: quinolinate synthase NadA [Planctomycetes bacterium]|nr:quinolinate synthase NadA [Planctomycetota bacterium]
MPRVLCSSEVASHQETRVSPTALQSSGIVLQPEIPICQTDLPLDWYQAEFKPYAEEYLALPDRKPSSVLPWLDRYVKPAQAHFGDTLLLVAHFYMGGEIVKLVERYGGSVADSYQLALQAARHPEKKVIVESAVHFMAEAIAILAHDDQSVWITNPKAGCTMEMLAKDYMVLPVAEQLIERYGDELVVVAYMNTGGRLKSLAGRTGGAVCTSSNAHKVVRWALAQDKKVFFVPDQHLGRNTAKKLGLDLARVVALPDPQIGRGAFKIDDKVVPGGLGALDRAQMILWGAFCGVHTVFKPEHVRYWQEHGYRVLVHPESKLEVVQAADGEGSTNFLWDAVMKAPRGSKIAIGTEGHFVRNAREQGKLRGVEIVHLADIPDPAFQSIGCGCATMSRNDPPHLAGMLDLLRKGTPPDANRVLAGDMVDEATGLRDRLSESERASMIADARRSLERMIEITEAK